MKHIHLNLKRFDVPVELGGVNRIAPVNQWGRYIVRKIQQGLEQYRGEEVEFTAYFPEAHILPALEAREEENPIQIGCQGVYRFDVTPGGNFGAFTTNRPAASARALGCSSVIIGHCEERGDLMGILEEAEAREPGTVANRLLNQEVRAAVAQGLDVLYCVGEKSEEQPRWKEVLKEQLVTGLEGVDLSKVMVAYEPVANPSVTAWRWKP